VGLCLFLRRIWRIYESNLYFMTFKGERAASQWTCAGLGGLDFSSTHSFSSSKFHPLRHLFSIPTFLPSYFFLSDFLHYLFYYFFLPFFFPSLLTLFFLPFFLSIFPFPPIHLSLSIHISIHQWLTVAMQCASFPISPFRISLIPCALTHNSRQSQLLFK